MAAKEEEVESEEEKLMKEKKNEEIFQRLFNKPTLTDFHESFALMCETVNPLERADFFRSARKVIRRISLQLLFIYEDFLFLFVRLYTFSSVKGTGRIYMICRNYFLCERCLANTDQCS